METYGRPTSTFSVDVTSLNRRRRLGRAARISLPLLLGAMVSLPVPAWHLFAVPGFLIAAGVLGVRRLREHELLGPIRGSCPACETPQELPPPPGRRFPFVAPCPGCGAYLTVRPEGSPLASATSADRDPA
ncbi:MAG: hypothetical protein V3T14_10005 [Myxococcota bacterium]